MHLHSKCLHSLGPFRLRGGQRNAVWVGRATKDVGQGLCAAARLCEPVFLLPSRFRFYLCLFSGPSTSLPKVRKGLGLPGHTLFSQHKSMLGGLLWSCVPCMKEPSRLRLLQVLGGNSRPCSLSFRPVGLPQVWMYMFLYRDCELQGDLRACFLQGLTESQDADQACESTFTSERYGAWVWAPGRVGHYSLLSPEPQLRHSCSTKEMLQPDGPLGLCLPPLQDEHWGSLGFLCEPAYAPSHHTRQEPPVQFPTPSPSHFQVQPGSLPSLAPASSSPSS